jgi:8-oxo-dGTP pyrophosphatase MutT (NUDIX family)
VADRDRLRAVFGRGVTNPPPPERYARAAVAAVFRSGVGGSELLFIERATREGDPWSGQMAMPGGRVQPEDRDSAATAARETWEELGLDLALAEHLGRLDDLYGGARPIAVAAHGYWWDGSPPDLRINHEVADALWLPLAELGDASRWVDYPFNGQVFPGIAITGSRVIWGMTLRLLHDLFDRLEQPFLTLP